MDGFVFVLALGLGAAAVLLVLAFTAKGRKAVYLKAAAATLSAWFAGLLLDVNIDVGQPAGLLSLRTLLPMLAMGLCILNAVTKNRPE